MRSILLVAVAFLGSVGVCSTAAAATEGAPKSWPQEPSTFMGIKFGESLTAQIPRCPLDKSGHVTTEVAAHKGELCFAWNRLYKLNLIYGDSLDHSLRVVAILVDNKVEGYVIDLARQAYPETLDTLIARYGPATETNTIQWRNKLGGSFDCTVSSWVGKSVHIVLSEIGDKIDESRLQVSTSVLRETEAAKGAQKGP